MSIQEVTYENEKELDKWVAENIEAFIPDAVYLPGIRVSTVSGKGGIPDGFAFDLENNQWYVIESELLQHGVWPHIAEQIVRFVVAMQNQEARRAVRDHLFEAIVKSDSTEQACEALRTSPERLLQQIELFIESIDPQVLIFIDETNEDLHEMAQAMSSSVKIFRVKKFMVNGQPEYHSPDKEAPVIVTEGTPEKGVPITEYDVVEMLGGGEVDSITGRFKYYRMEDGSVLHMKRSKYHERNDNYWYGVTPLVIDRCEEAGVTHLVFVMGGEGFVKVPLSTVKEFVEHTRYSTNEDGSVSHYHCLISPGPDAELYYSSEVPSFDISDHYHPV